MHFSEPVLLSYAYFGPIQYFSKLASHPVLIENHENYSKQSYRNRCIIYGANGPLTLTVPIVKDHGQKMPIGDVRIDYSTPWQNNHFRAIVSAYRSAPFFEFYMDAFEPFFEKKTEFLADLDLQVTKTLCSCLEIEVHFGFTDGFGTVPANIDWRDGIHPKKRMQKHDPNFIAPEYHQVFADKHGLQKNLSILDLIFNCGPESKSILRNAYKTNTV
jgi:hypothetical protein